MTDHSNSSPHNK